MVESCVTRILLRNDNDYKSFIIYCIIFLICDLYIIFGQFYNYVLSKAIKSQNYLAVCWFIQANKIDIQQFITEWIANHRTVCFDKDCEICEELIKGHLALEEALKIENDENKDNKDDDEKDPLNGELGNNNNNNTHNKNQQGGQGGIKKDNMNDL